MKPYKKKIKEKKKNTLISGTIVIILPIMIK